MQLTEDTARKIKALRYDHKAEIIYCPLPLGSIYFSDELPDGLLPERVGDFIQVMRVLGIRVNLWNGLALSEEDRAIWEEASIRFSDWPIFKRLELTLEQRKAHEGVLEDVEAALASLNDATGNNE
jgi:hypothetical protein